ncbi:MAG: hypothetical protein FWG35_06000 [Spirochaetaceae bacterium]|nr:hypothetical protein [Spirochaetaceae bacterium]
MGLGFGIEGLYNGEYTPTGTESKTLLYQSLGLHPQFRAENFDMALDLVARFRFDGGDNEDEFELRDEDWRTHGAWEILNLYLPKIRFARYGTKGDPIAVRLADIDGISYGNGFIVSSYTNTLFQPENRILGAVIDIDGSIVDIPYFGIEAFTANAARCDLAAGRLYVHPLAGFDLSILKGFEIGGTFAMDRNPYYFADRYAMYNSFLATPWSDETALHIYGLDFSVPLLTDPAFGLTLFGDRVSQNSRVGWMAGASGRVANAVIWEGQFRILDDGFIPEYFDASYDLYRPEKYAVYDSGSSGAGVAESCYAYLGALGLSLFEDKLVFKVVSEGPVWSAENRLYSWRGILELKEGLIPYFSCDILYDKKNMANFDDFAAWKQDSLLRARFHYHTGPVVLSLAYILRYMPSDFEKDRQILMGIEGRIRLH